MLRFNIFCVLLLQIILFAQPTVSEIHAFTISLEDLQREGMVLNFPVPTKQCPEIRYTLDSMPFLIVPCFDKSSKEFEVTLKVGNVDLGQETGAFDDDIFISFDHGQLLNGEHRYYLKDNYLWLHYDTMLFGRKNTGDKKLTPVPSGFISPEDAIKLKSSERAPKRKRKEDASEPKSKEDAPGSNPKGNASKPKPKTNTPKPKPKKDASKPKSRYDM